MSNYRGQIAFSTRDVYKDKGREEGVRRKKITMDPEKRSEFIRSLSKQLRESKSALRHRSKSRDKELAEYKPARRSNSRSKSPYELNREKHIADEALKKRHSLKSPTIPNLSSREGRGMSRNATSLNSREKEIFDFPKDLDPSEVKVTKGGGLEMIGGFVGFANLPNQVHRKSVKKGFEFTMMAVGESGLGKSTLINSLFLTNLYEEREVPEAAIKAKQTVSIEASTVEIEERGVKLRLTVVDTPGFGDAIDNKNAFDPIIEYIDKQFERYLHDESGLNRRHIVDNRVHCCFYFINPCGHGLRPIDIEFMKTLQTRVNLVPLIAKADMLTPKEIKKFKKRVLEELGKNQIHIYQLPDVEDDEDEDFKQQTQQLKSMIPFAVVGSTQLIEVKGKKVRGRLYPWGVVEVENPDHNDFTGLRTMLISHMQDLQEVTHDLHYEKYRASRLGDEPEAPMMAPMGSRPPPDAEKDRILHEKEMELQKMQKMIEQMQMQLTMQQKASASADKNSKSHKV